MGRRMTPAPGLSFDEISPEERVEVGVEDASHMRTQLRDPSRRQNTR